MLSKWLLSLPWDATKYSPRQCGQHWPLRRTGTLQLAAGQLWEKHWMVPLLQVQLVQALAFQESPVSSISPSLDMQCTCWLLFTGRRGLRVSSVTHTGVMNVNDGKKQEVACQNMTHFLLNLSELYESTVLLKDSCILTCCITSHFWALRFVFKIRCITVC